MIFGLFFTSGISNAFNLQSSKLNFNDVIGEGVTIGSFGTELEFHKTGKSNGQWRLLVGAPTSGNGTVYNCDPVAGDCDELDFSGCINQLRGPQHLYGNINDKWYYDDTNQNLGLTISSSGIGGSVAVCAPQFQLKQADKLDKIKENVELGKCFILDNNLKTKESDKECFKSPCEDMLFKVEESKEYHQLGYQFCAAGISVDWGTETDEIIMGLPGSLSYAGNMVSIRKVVEDSSFFDMDSLKPQIDPLTWISKASENVMKNQAADHCFNEYIYNNRTGLGCNHYIGASVRTGDFTNSGQYSYIAGGLRMGKVNFYSKEINDDGDEGLFETFSSISSPSSYDLDDDITGFGSIIEKIDFNDDGHLDLVIGAPLFYKVEHGSKSGTEGAVYIYLNNGQGAFTPEPVWTMYGAQGSRFGAELHNIGDINLDNIHDLAVSAPGENKVYIYHGRRGTNENQIELIPAQVLEPLSENTVSFGYSITSADFDGNKYSDLAVGSLKGGVTLFRSRPIIDLVGNLNVSRNKMNLSKDKQTQVTVCFAFRERSDSIDEKIRINYVLRLDDDDTLVQPRFSFDEKDDKLTEINRNITVSRIALSTEKKDNCENPILHPIFLNSQFVDKLRPVKVNLTWSLIETETKKRTRRESELEYLPPILDQENSQGEETNIKLELSCGSDDICSSQLKAIGKFQLSKSIDGQSEWSDIRRIKRKRSKRNAVLNLGEEDQIGFLVNAENQAEDAHQASFTLHYPNEVLQYQGYNTFDEAQRCFKTMPIPMLAGTHTAVICNLGNPFKTRDDAQANKLKALNQGQIRLKFQKTDKLRYQSAISFYLNVNTTSAQEPKEAKEYKLKIQLKPNIKIQTESKTDQIKFKLIERKEGRLGTESIRKVQYDSLSEVIGPKVTHKYTFYHKSSLIIPELQVTLKWPMKLKNGKYLLYLFDIEKSSNVKCYREVEIKNPEKYPTSNSVRSKRASEKSSEVQSTPQQTRMELQGALSAPVTITCDPNNRNSADCTEIFCTITDLQRGSNRGASITLVGFAWESTFSDEFLNVFNPITRLVIQSTAKVDMNMPGVNITLDDSDLERSITLTADSAEKLIMNNMVPWWIIILAAIGGLLILIIIIIILWKMGFFKRGDAKYKPQLHKAERQSQKSKKAIQKDIYSHDKPLIMDN